MKQFSYRTVETRLFNQAATFEVCGEVKENGEIKLTELFAVGQDEKGETVLEPIHNMLNMPAIHDAVVSLLNEWTHSLIFTNEQEQR